MTHPNPSSAIARVIVDELARNGVSRAVISPGSRSTALVLALTAREEFETVVHIDERSAGFRALGHSAGCGVPGLAVTTSGSAVANLLPAVVEADRSAQPLILLTADRPPELVKRRTNQTMDQESVFSGFLRGRFQLGPAEDTAGEPESWRDSVRAAVALTTGGGGSPGPVQINVAFEEPTVPVADDGRSKATPYVTDTTGMSARAIDPPPSPSGVTPSDLIPGRRTLVIAGRGDYDGAALEAVCRAADIPLLATALSGARGVGTVSAYHHLLVDGVPAGLEPDWVYVVGQPGPSDRLATLMHVGVPVVHADRWGLFSDVSGTMTDAMQSDPVEWLRQHAVDQKPGWAESWVVADGAVRDSLDLLLAQSEKPTGPGIARSLNEIDWQALVVASSLSVRDVDSQLTRPGWVFANRGLSGIDGFNSTALGVADCRESTVAVTGDLAFLHDSNAFLTDQTAAMVFLVVDNGGGGLFDLLPQAQHAPDFERLFITPPGRDLSVLAAFHGLAFSTVESAAEVAPGMKRAMGNDGVSVVRVAVDRQEDLSMRRALDGAARVVLGAR